MSLPRPADSRQIDAHHRLGRRLATPHLPQGAPTSPALANLAAFRLDRRLTGLAASHEVSYTRYADDLTFSGPARLVRAANTPRRAVPEIAREEGFAVNDHKSMLATRAGRQRVCGVVVNERLNVPRYEYDILEAILHNSRVHGPASQNREDILARWSSGPARRDAAAWCHRPRRRVPDRRVAAGPACGVPEPCWA